MERVAKFEKVSFEQFKKDVISCFPTEYNDDEIQKIYDKIELPKRETTGSAGYDINSPFDFALASRAVESQVRYAGQGQTEVTSYRVDCNPYVPTFKMPTGIRCYISEGWVMKVYPRSGLGFKYGTALVNTVGVIDSDYYFSDNGGHIFIKIKTDDAIKVNAGDGIAQAIFEQYGITMDDNAVGIRNGGFGSTGA